MHPWASAAAIGIPSEQASMLYTCMAIAFFFSNNLVCKLSEMKCLDIFDFYQFTTKCMFGHLSAAGTLGELLHSVVTLSLLYGLMDGGRYGLMPLLVLDCVGQKKTDDAWGYVAFCVGLTVAIGLTVIGKSAKRSGKLTRVLHGIAISFFKTADCKLQVADVCRLL